MQAIVASEPETDRFWVGHDMPNTPSARGIARAGFREVGILYRLAGGNYLLVPSGAAPRAAAAGALFGVAVAAARSPRSA